MRKVVMLLLWLPWSAAALAETAALLVYQVWERGLEPYQSRVMVTDDYVRLDEGAGSVGFTLFDRAQEIIYNVVPEDRVVFVMNPVDPLPEADPALVLQAEVAVDKAAPEVAGRQPKDVRLLANGELCAELVVVEDLMEDALDGLRELKLTLARIESSMLDRAPFGSRAPCDLAAGIYAADRSLSFGLPLQERADGRSQSLVDFAPEQTVDRALFELPRGFVRRPMRAPAVF